MKADRQSRCGSILKKVRLRLSSKGFTLVELMVVVAMVAIMLVAAVPAVNSWMTRQALQYATDELYSDIQLARIRAARNNQRCRILINVPALNQYTIQDIGNDGLLQGTVKVVDLSKYRDRITFVNSPDPVDPPPYAVIEFLSQGILNLAVTAPAVSDSIYLTNQANDVFNRIQISIAGGTGMDRWTASQNAWR